MINDTRLVFVFDTRVLLEVLYRLHCEIRLVLTKDTRLEDTIPYDKDVNDKLIKDSRLADTIPYDKDVNDELIKDTRLVFVFDTRVIWQVLYRLHCAIRLVFTKDTRLEDTIPYDKDVNDELIKDTRLVFVFVTIVI